MKASDKRKNTLLASDTRKTMISFMILTLTLTLTKQMTLKVIRARAVVALTTESLKAPRILHKFNMAALAVTRKERK